MSNGNPNRPRGKRGRPRDDRRDAALEAGAIIYAGKPCRKGHKGKRYVSTGACVECVAGYRLASDDFDLF